MQVTQSVAAFESVFHLKAGTLRKRREGCGIRAFVPRLWPILVWYYPPRVDVNAGKYGENGALPAQRLKPKLFRRRYTVQHSRSPTTAGTRNVP